MKVLYSGIPLTFDEEEFNDVQNKPSTTKESNNLKIKVLHNKEEGDDDSDYCEGCIFPIRQLQPWYFIVKSSNPLQLCLRGILTDGHQEKVWGSGLIDQILLCDCVLTLSKTRYILLYEYFDPSMAIASNTQYRHETLQLIEIIKEYHGWPIHLQYIHELASLFPQSETNSPSPLPQELNDEVYTENVMEVERKPSRLRPRTYRRPSALIQEKNKRKRQSKIKPIKSVSKLSSSETTSVLDAQLARIQRELNQL